MMDRRGPNLKIKAMLLYAPRMQQDTFYTGCIRVEAASGKWYKWEALRDQERIDVYLLLQEAGVSMAPMFDALTAIHKWQEISDRNQISFDLDEIRSLSNQRKGN